MTYSVPRGADRKSIRYHPDYALPPFYCRRPHPPQGVPTFTDQRTLPYLPTIHDALLTHGAFGHSPCGNLIFSPICTQPVVFWLGQVLILSNKDMSPNKVYESNVCQYVSLEKNPLEKNVSELVSEKNGQLHIFSTLEGIFTQPTEYWLG